MPPEPVLLAVMGTTVSGKTALAEALADRTGMKLINADAFQVYRGLDIGTAKSKRASEYLMLDVVDPAEDFGVGEWITRLLPELRSLYEAGRGGIVVGGTLYYIRALFEEYQDLKGAPSPELRAALDARDLADLVEEFQRRAPEEALRVDLQNRARVQRAVERLDLPRMAFALPPFRKVKLGLEPRTELLGERIAARVEAMLEAGWLEEVVRLATAGVRRDDPGMRAHGYRALWDVVHGLKKLHDVKPGIALEVLQYAKRQRTWMRSEPNLAKLPMQDEGVTLAAALDLLWGSYDGENDQPAGHVPESGS